MYDEKGKQKVEGYHRIKSSIFKHLFMPKTAFYLCQGNADDAKKLLKALDLELEIEDMRF